MILEKVLVTPIPLEETTFKKNPRTEPEQREPDFQMHALVSKPFHWKRCFPTRFPGFLTRKKLKCLPMQNAVFLQEHGH